MREIWKERKKEGRKQLESLQKRIIKICFKKPIGYPTDFIFN